MGKKKANAAVLATEETLRLVLSLLEDITTTHVLLASRVADLWEEIGDTKAMNGWRRSWINDRWWISDRGELYGRLQQNDNRVKELKALLLRDKGDKQ